ncbi:hypothetical protein HGM15179_017560 [Zosterops borbonicus]|uniref:Uncharacterized protein n=1 Tax=Zosterops borbonicus TaxID=364589 RepID=A0A8K1G0U5_9PASS|nr:hypothetical protein HGM15179_017560 [Zosterops borbonicus]
MKDNFLGKVIDSPTRGDTALDLLVASIRELISAVKFGGSLGYDKYAVVDFAALRDMGQSKSTVRTLNFGKASFQLFKELVGHLLNFHQGQGSRTKLTDSKDVFHKVQKLPIPRCKKLVRETKRSLWLSQARPTGQTKGQEGKEG